MRRTLIVAALVGLAVPGGAGVAAAQEPTLPAECWTTVVVNGKPYCLNAVPSTGGETGSFGYGSAGTAPLSAIVNQGVLAGSSALSLQIPIAIGSYGAPSTGSHGPEAVVGQLSAAATGSLIKGSLGS